MKKRWKGLCALWMVLALVIGAGPVSGAADGVPEPALAAMSEATKDGGGQALADSDAEGSSGEIMSEISRPQTENTPLAENENTEDPGEDGTGKPPEQGMETEETGNGTEGAEPEEPDEGEEGTESTEGIERPEEGTGESTDAAGHDGESAKSTEAVSEEEESSSVGETSLDESPLEESTLEEIPPEESLLEESSQEEIPEATDPVLTDLELPERAPLPAKAAEAGETAESGEAWLYVGSGEVKAGSYIGDAEGAASCKQSVTVQFNASFDSQGWRNDIRVPQTKSLSGWKLWKFNSGMFVDGDLGELEITGQISADNYQNFEVDNTHSFLLIVPLLKAKDISDGESLEMDVGDSCNLPEGTWQVDGDTTLYTVDTGGRIVYAARKKRFIFRKK